MERLLYSSKFWALVFGGVALALSAIFGVNDAQADSLVKQVLAIYAMAAPIIYAVMTGLEDAFSDGEVSLDELIEILKDLLTEE